VMWAADHMENLWPVLAWCVHGQHSGAHWCTLICPLLFFFAWFWKMLHSYSNVPEISWL
jgi:hypothetical protein